MTVSFVTQLGGLGFVTNYDAVTMQQFHVQSTSNDDIVTSLTINILINNITLKAFAYNKLNIWKSLMQFWSYMYIQLKYNRNTR